MDFREIGLGGVDWIYLTQDREVYFLLLPLGCEFNKLEQLVRGGKSVDSHCCTKPF
jgi:hypothetical protein